LDDSTNPVGEFETLSNFIHNPKTKWTVNTLTSSAGFEVRLKKNNHSEYTEYEQGTKLLAGITTNYGDIVRAFPTEN